MSDWRKLPKVCKPRSGAANVSRYKGVMVMQPPYEFNGRIHGWCALGPMPYVGPLRTAIMDHRTMWLGHRLVWRHHA